MIYLDTHVVVWLYAGQSKKIPTLLQKTINENEILISPMVVLELNYLFEIERISNGGQVVVTDLSKKMGLRIASQEFHEVILQALDLSWTRDPFDRIIVAHAALDGSTLISKDQTILKQYPYAVWET